jgi:hypothetical protein
MNDMNGALMIRQVGNGFLVSPESDLRRNGMVGNEEMMVFQSYSELLIFLAQHFSHRAYRLNSDAAP